MIDLKQVQAAVAVIEQKLPGGQTDKELEKAIRTLLYATVSSIASIANSLEKIAAKEVKE